MIMEQGRDKRNTRQYAVRQGNTFNIREQRQPRRQQLRGLGDDDTGFEDNYGFTPSDPGVLSTPGYTGGSYGTYGGPDADYPVDANGDPVFTSLPTETLPAGSTPPTYDFDPQKIIKIGTQLYRYVRQVNAQGQVYYGPQPYYGNSAFSNPLLLVGIAAAAFLLLS